jgi:hypothetical protein
LEIENQIPSGNEKERQVKARVLLLGKSVVDSADNGKSEENKSGNRKEIEPKAEVVILEGSKKTGDVHYIITKYSLSVIKRK